MTVGEWKDSGMSFSRAQVTGLRRCCSTLLVQLNHYFLLHSVAAEVD